MGGAHAHGPAPDVGIDRRARFVLLGSLLLAAVLTVAGMVALWPAADERPAEVPFAGDGVREVSAEVVAVADPCPVIAVDPALPTPPGGERPDFPDGCGSVTVTVEGSEEPVTIQPPPYVARAGLQAGDGVSLLALPAQDGVPPQYAFVAIDRGQPVAVLAVAFVVVVALVARLRGLLALLGLGIAGLVLAFFVLPALLAGRDGFTVAAVGSSAIMFVVLYLAHGPSLRTSAALAGTLLGVGATALIGLWGIDRARLAGIGESGEQLLLYAPDLDYQGLLAAAVVIAGLGVLNDVTITQASAVWELRAAAPGLGRRQLFTSGMRIGRDHIASTIYTIVFVYAGAALSVLMLIALYDRPLLSALGEEAIAEEVVRTLASAIGLVLAVPLTTGIAALTVSGPVSGPARAGAAEG